MKKKERERERDRERHIKGVDGGNKERQQEKQRMRRKIGEEQTERGTHTHIKRGCILSTELCVSLCM